MMEHYENTAASQQQGNTVAGAGDGSQQQEKIFTQKDVDRIIGERLSRVKIDASPELQERERQCTQRELQLDARERLADAGLPKELLGVINCNTKEDLENSIKTIQKLFGQNGSTPQAQQPRTTYRISSGVSGSSNGSGSHTGVDDPASIRKAMGLKG